MTGEEIVRRAGIAAWHAYHRVVPPPEPEPLTEDPLAWLPLPRWPDPYVFGPPGSGDLQGWRPL